MRCNRFSRISSLLVIMFFCMSFFVIAQDETLDSSSGVNDAANQNVLDGSTSSTETVVAESSGFSETKQYDWLEKTSGNEPGDIQTQVLTLVALNNKNKDVKSRVQMLLSQQDKTLGCFSSDDCSVIDTAFALVGQQVSNQDTTKAKEYLLNENALTPGLRTGEWRLQLDVSGSGSCDITYGDDEKTKTFTIEEGVIKNTAGKYYISIGKELDGNLIGRKVSQPIQVDCKDLSGVASLVYYLKASNSYFLLDSQSFSAGISDLKIVNACFRAKAGSGGCDLDSSLYATWALVEAGEDIADIGTLPYLESVVITSNTNDLQKALLVRILQKSGNANEFFDNLLVNNQRNGAWGRGDIYITAWALFALQKASGAYSDTVSSATEFLQKRVDDNGGWASNVKATAMALVALKGGELSRGFLGPVESLGSGEASLDDICLGNAADQFGVIGCGSIKCRDYSKGDFSCMCSNGIQDPEEEGVDCGSACFNLCDNVDNTGLDNDIDFGSIDNTGSSTNLPSTEPGTSTSTSQGSSVWLWVIIIIIILALALGGAAYYVKSKGIDVMELFKKKNKGQSFEQFKMQTQNRPQIRPQQGPMPARPQPVVKHPPLKKPTYDDALEKSLKEAEKLLKGNK